MLLEKKNHDFIISLALVPYRGKHELAVSHITNGALKACKGGFEIQ